MCRNENPRSRELQVRLREDKQINILKQTEKLLGKKNVKRFQNTWSNRLLWNNAYSLNESDNKRSWKKIQKVIIDCQLKAENLPRAWFSTLCAVHAPGLFRARHHRLDSLHLPERASLGKERPPQTAWKFAGVKEGCSEQVAPNPLFWPLTEKTNEWAWSLGVKRGDFGVHSLVRRWGTLAIACGGPKDLGKVRRTKKYEKREVCG